MNEGNDELVFVPLGGVGEIGMNLALYGFGRKGHLKWLMVDCGVAFAGPDLAGDRPHHPGHKLHRKDAG